MSTLESIPFNRPHMTGRELFRIAEAHFNGKLSGDGPFTKRCHEWFEEKTGTLKALLTHSCTAALEMSALLLDIEPDDEVIMPSYTFVSTANAFVLRGATPVFVDIRPDTLNLDETLLEQAITPKTKAVVPVHYAGVGCEMDEICAIAKRYGLRVIEDAAQGMMAQYKSRALGAIGDLGTYSFHETKNVVSGEGGALLVNNEEYAERAEIIREKGTNRSQFLRGQVDKYTWQDVGSSFLPGELIAAFLSAQLDEAQEITDKRLRLWDLYHDAFAELEAKELLRRPVVPEYCTHNAHMYYVLLPKHCDRDQVLFDLKKRGINAVFHYVPLHSAPAGQKYGKVSGTMVNTDELSARLIRLPLWVGMKDEDLHRVVASVKSVIS